MDYSHYGTSSVSWGTNSSGYYRWTYTPPTNPYPYANLQSGILYEGNSVYLKAKEDTGWDPDSNE